jgi:F-type H+-transporting ATPase subunit b
MYLASSSNQNPILPDNTELVIGAIAFLIVFGVLYKILLPRIQKTLEERTAAIEGGLEKATETQEEAKRTLQQYQAQLAEARHEASRLRQDAQEAGAQILAELREQGEAERQRRVAAAHEQIEAERAQALQALRAEVGALAVELASRVVGESLDEVARQRRVVDRFLAELETESAPSSRGRS